MANFSSFTRSIIDDYHKHSGIVHEDENIASLFYALISKEFRKDLRLHTIVQNLSGAGKSTLVDAVVQPFKQECPQDVIEISRFTGPALERYGNFDGKILYHIQAFGDEPQTVLPLLSGENLGLMVSERDEKTNKFISKIYNVEGMPSFVSTTVVKLDPQLLRRVILRTCDESAQQTRAILEAEAREFSEIIEQASLKGSFPFVRGVIKKIFEARPKSTIDKVIIPYAPLLEKKIPDNLEMRSNFKKFLRLIGSVALVKSICFRGSYEIETKPEPPLKKMKRRVVIATVEDLNDGYKIAGKSFFQPLAAAESTVLEYLGKQIENNQINGSEEYRKVRIKELVQDLKLARSYITQITQTLSDLGLISRDLVEDRGRKIVEMQFIKPAIEIEGFDPGELGPETWLEGKKFEKIEVEDPLGV